MFRAHVDSVRDCDELVRLARESRDEARQLVLIETLREGRRLQSVWPLVICWAMGPSKWDRRRATADETWSQAGAAAAWLFGRASPGQRQILGQQLRRWRESHHWHIIGPSVVSSLADATGDRPRALGVLSEHPSGHVREAALAELRRESVEDALAFILPRLNDWVDAIRKAAEAWVLRSTEDELPIVVENLELIDRIEHQRRRERRALQHLRGLLASARGRRALRGAWSHADPRLRRLAFRTSLELGVALDEIVEAAARDPEPLIRRWAVTLMPRLPRAEAAEALRWAVGDRRYAGVRVAALDRLEPHLEPSDAALLETAALDPNPGVQLTARFLLGKHFGGRDFRAQYLAALEEPEPRRRLGAMVGLGTVGSKEDAMAILEAARATRPRLRRAGLTAAASLDLEAARPELLRAVAAPEPGVSKRAREVLSGQLRPSDARWLRDLIAAPEAHVRRNALLLASALGGWSALPIVLEGARDRDEAIVELSRGLLQRWLRTMVLSAYRPKAPDDDERGAVVVAMERCGSRLPDELRAPLVRFLRAEGVLEPHVDE